MTVAAEYCGFLERARDMKRYDFVDTALKILPLLYLKATLLPPCEPIGEDEPEIFVTEEDYELIRRTCLLYTSPSPRDGLLSRMPSSA